MLNLHVVLAVDRAGLVGEDGPTHHGVFDVGFLKQMPGMTVLSPATYSELKAAMYWAVYECQGPVAVRYPRGVGMTNESISMADTFDVIDYFADMPGNATLISYGTVAQEMLSAARALHTDGIGCAALRLLSPTHFSREKLAEMIKGKHVFVIEEVASGAGISGDIAMLLQEKGLGCRVHAIDLGKDFTPHGNIRSLYKHTGLDRNSIYDYVREVLSHEE